MTEPTDKELEAFAIEEQFLLFCDVDEFTQIARAVLAKWGTPQPTQAVPHADIAQLRHLYQNMLNGGVRDTASAKRIAEGLLAPVIERMERAMPPAGREMSAGSCWCLTCRPMRFEDPCSIRMALCPACGNKRCPKANDHRNTCTGSNEPGQPGSAYVGGIKGGQHGAE